MFASLSPATAGNLLAVTVLAFAILVTWRTIVKMKRGMPAFDYEPRQFVPWGVVDIGLALLVTIAAQGLLFSFFKTDTPPSATDAESLASTISTMMASSLGMLVAAVGTFLIIRLRTGATNADLGIDHNHFGRDVADGARAFLLVVVPVMALQVILMLFNEPEHPIVKLLLAAPSTNYFFASALMAVIIAPIAEEFFFRVVLQGWLENIATVSTLPVEIQASVEREQLVLGGRKRLFNTEPIEVVDDETDGIPVSQQPAIAENDGENPYVSPSFSAEPAAQAPQPNVQVQPRAWPIIATSLFFAMAHWGHGTDPIPLFLFALALGYLYQRTHRLLPCVVAHALLNGFSLVQLWLSIAAGTAGT